MRLVWHLTKHDLRATRLLASVWLAVVTLEIVVVIWSPVAVIISDRSDDAVAMVFDLARWLGAAMLTTLIVQRDPLGDPTAFWRTRPIAPVLLWLSKMTSIVLLPVAAPMLVMAVALWLAGVSPAVAARYATNLGLDHSMIVAATLLVAVPTRSTAQAVTAAFATLVSLVVGSAVLDAMRPPRATLWTLPPPDVALVLCLTAVIAITGLHYLTQRRRLALLSSVGFVAVTMAVNMFGASPASGAVDGASAGRPAGAVTVTLGPDGEWRSGAPGQEQYERFSTSIRATAATPDRFYLPIGVTATIHVAAGPVPVPTATIETSWDGRPPPSLDDTPYRNLRQLTGVETLVLPPVTRGSAARLELPVPDAARGEMQDGRGHLSAVVVLTEHRLSMGASLATIGGATAETAAGRMRVIAVQSVPGYLAIDLHSIGPGAAGAMPVLVSADRRRGILAEGDLRRGAVPPSEPRSVSMGGWRLSLTSRRERLHFQVPAAVAAMRQGAWQGATVAVVDARGTGRVLRATLDVDGIGRVP